MAMLQAYHEACTCSPRQKVNRSLETKGWLNHQGHLPFNNEDCF